MKTKANQLYYNRKIACTMLFMHGTVSIQSVI